MCAISGAIIVQGNKASGFAEIYGSSNNTSSDNLFLLSWVAKHCNKSDCKNVK